MADNTFDSEELDIQFQPINAYIDSDGAFKLNTPMLSSFDFDGSVPKFEGEIDAVDVMPGFLIQVETGGEYYRVESIEVDEPDIDASGLVTINYIDEQGQITSVDYDETDQVNVVYEDWDEKVLGTRGWGITSGGNAIFTNVAVRGRIEAEEGYISGTLTIGDGGSSTLGDVATQDDISDFITGPEVNTNVTSISGGVITTGRIKNSTYNGPVSGGGSFSTTGSQFNIDDGTIVTPAFRVDSSGNGYFKGDISAATGTFTGDLSGADISGGTITGTTFESNLISSNKIMIGKTFSGVTSNRIVWYDNSAVITTNNRFWQIGLDTNRDLILTYDQAHAGIRKFGVNGNLEVTSGVITGSGAGLYGTANSLNVNYATSAGTATTATTATTAGSATTAGTAGGLTGTPFISISPYSFSNTQTDLQIRTSDGRVGIFTSRMDVKTNIVPLSGVQSEVVTPEKDGLGITSLALNPDDIFNVTPIQYNPIDDPEHLEIGFIVEDLLQKWPAAVTYDAEGNPLTYNTTPIVAGLVYAVKTLKNKVDSLESRVIQLESQLGG